MTPRQILSTLLCFIGLTGCMLGPNYQRPKAPISNSYTAKRLPKSTVATAVNLGNSQKFVTKDIPAQWWALFHSKALNDLVCSSLKNNPDVAAAQAALRVSLETVYAQQSTLYPNIQASYTPTRQRVASTLTSPVSTNALLFNLHTAQLTLSYMPDVFGGNRRLIESLSAQLHVQEFQLEATYLTLTANVINAAIEEAALREQIAAMNEVVALQTRISRLYQQQFKLGQVALADLRIQDANLAASQALLPPLQKALAIQRDLLRALAGRFPSEQLAEQFKLASFHLPTELPLTLPSTLVEQRPDVRAAEEQLHAASAEIGIAVANRLPNITLGINNYGSAAYTLASLFASGTGFWTLIGTVSQPIFDGGTLKHRQKAAEAYYQQARAIYKSTVISAFQEVADTLQAIHIDAIALRAAQHAERAAAQSLAIAKRQLTLGDISPLLLLANQQAYQQARFHLIRAQANRLVDTVALFQALGGGWWNRNKTVVARISEA